MKNKVLISIVVIMAVLSVGTMTGFILANQGDSALVAEAQTETEKRDVLVVSGEGKVSLTPDIAFINAGVETMMEDAAKAQQENARVMARIIAALKAAGIQEKDIQTTNYSVSVEYDWNVQPRKLIGYRVTNNVRVSMRQIDRVGGILTSLAEAGANHFYGITFGVENQAKAYEEALQKAIASAKSEAGVMAKAAGVTLGRPVAIQEGYAPITFPIADMGMARAEAAVATPIMEGQLEVHATVTIVYSIR